MKLTKLLKVMHATEVHYDLLGVTLTIDGKALYLPQEAISAMSSLVHDAAGTALAKLRREMEAERSPFTEMNPGLTFLLFMAAVFSIFGSILIVVFHGDRLLVMVLRLIDAPVYPEARMIAALIYQHPEQWKMGTYQMEHPSVGQIWAGHSANGVHIEGKFGRWDPESDRASDHRQRGGLVSLCLHQAAVVRNAAQNPTRVTTAAPGQLTQRGRTLFMANTRNTSKVPPMPRPAPRSPTVTIAVTHKSIANSLQRKSSHCMIASRSGRQFRPREVYR